MASEIEALRDILNSSIDNILGVCTKTGKNFPSLNEPAQQSEFSPDSIRNDPDVSYNTNLAISAAMQLVATLQPPVVHLWNSAYKFTLPVCLSIAEATNVAEILRDAGPDGMHVNEIAKKGSVDPKKLERVLRFLATNHYFREVKERVFAHNLLSSLLDTGKPLEECTPTTKHANTNGLAAMAGYAPDECLKAAAGYKELMCDPKTAFSEELEHCGFKTAFNSNTMWEFYELPENQYRCDRFNLVMAGANGMHPESILTGFNWEEVQNGTLVDVGSGTGHNALQVAKKYPNMQIILEDRPSVMEHAKEHWNEQLPSHVSSGKVRFIPTDFLKNEQSLPGPPDVFLLRWILHDWPDKYAILLLKNLRKAAAEGKTRLVIVENVMDYACESHDDSIKEIGGEATKLPPKPLLPNLGGANLVSYALDVVVLTNCNAGERTIQGYIEILEASGWKFLYVQRRAGNKVFWPSIVAVPNPDYVPS